jgi:hypothetical protein
MLVSWEVVPGKDATMSSERTALTRLLDAVWLLLLFEVALLLDEERIVFVTGLIVAAAIGYVLRSWWMAPLIPVAMILILNVHVRLFGEIVELPPEYGWEVEFAPFLFAVFLTVASLVAALIGTAIGKIGHEGGATDS